MRGPPFIELVLGRACHKGGKLIRQLHKTRQIRSQSIVPKKVEALLGSLEGQPKESQGHWRECLKDLRLPSPQQRSFSTQEDPMSPQCLGSTRAASYQARRVGRPCPMASASCLGTFQIPPYLLSDKGQLQYTGSILGDCFIGRALAQLS